MRPFVLLVVILAGGLAARPCAASLVIAEVYYDADGADDEHEWVEIWNAGVADVDLSTWSLGWGGTTLVSGKLSLSGVIPSGARFLIGGPASDDGLPLAFDLAADLGPDLQNAGAVADAVALFDRPGAEVEAATLPYDLVLYGETNESGLLGPDGALAAVDVADAPGGSSIELGRDGIWRVQAEPTPGLAPQPVPEPHSAGLAAAGALAALRRARGRSAGVRGAKL